MSNVTLRTIFAYLDRHGVSQQEALDLPISIGVDDEYRNFDILTLYDKEPRLYTAHKDNKPIGIRLDGYLTIKCLKEKRKGKTQ